MNKGFTLVEVLVVSIIVAVLAAAAIPAYTDYIDRTSSQVCENTAAMVLKGVMVLAQDHPDISGDYTPETLGDDYDEFRIAYPKEYSVDIFINNADDITVVVKDNEFLGLAQIGT
ncbi:MAG: prepilin-type N-terminal cleavage/methylation domain-containing protein [Candidatus Delongbacteria bacterium]